MTSPHCPEPASPCYGPDMALYTRKNGEFVKLTRDQVRKMRRNDKVIELQKAAMTNAAHLRALTEWVRAIRVKSNAVAPQDLYVSALPNQARLLYSCLKVDEAIEQLRRT